MRSTTGIVMRMGFQRRRRRRQISCSTCLRRMRSTCSCCVRFFSSRLRRRTSTLLQQEEQMTYSCHCLLTNNANNASIYWTTCSDQTNVHVISCWQPGTSLLYSSIILLYHAKMIQCMCHAIYYPLPDPEILSSGQEKF